MSSDLAPIVAEHGARLDGHDRDVASLRTDDTRIERSLSGWLSSLDRKVWAIVMGVGLAIIGVFGSLFVNVLIYTAMTGSHK